MQTSAFKLNSASKLPRLSSGAYCIKMDQHRQARYGCNERSCIYTLPKETMLPIVEPDSLNEVVRQRTSYAKSM